MGIGVVGVNGLHLGPLVQGFLPLFGFQESYRLGVQSRQFLLLSSPPLCPDLFHRFLQGFDHLSCPLIAILRRFGQRLQNHPLHGLWDIGVDLPRQGQGSRYLLEQHGKRRVRLERHPPDQHLEQDNTQRVNIGSCINAHA